VEKALHQFGVGWLAALWEGLNDRKQKQNFSPFPFSVKYGETAQSDAMGPTTPFR
jgi:hypothetical protein